MFSAVELGHESRRDFHRKDRTGYLGNPAMVKLLLEHGADPNQVDIYGQTPLSYAIRAQDGDHREVSFANLDLSLD
jgi:ankyrin repeat protein